MMNNVDSEQDLRQKIFGLYKSEHDGLLAYKLLNFIYATNRSTILRLKPVDFVVTSEVFDSQYLVIPDDH